MTIRIGFYGAGFISQFHTYFLHNSGVDHEIVAVHDPDPGRAAAWAEARGASAVGEDELLDLVDAVYITTWTSEHARLVEKAASRGLSVFCEKPLAFDAATVEQMIAAVDAAGVVNQVGLVLRTMAPFRFLKRLIHDKRAGRVMTIVFRDDQYIPIQGQYGSDWRADPTKAGRGTLLEHSIHDVDILQWMLGPVHSLTATTREVHGISGIEDLAVARLDFESGAAVTLTSVWHDILERPSMRHIEVFCERLHVVVDNDMIGPVRWQFTGEDPQSLGADDLISALRDEGDVNDNPARSFLTSVRDRTAADPDLAAALPAHQLVDALYASAAAEGELVRNPYGTVGAGAAPTTPTQPPPRDPAI